MKADLFAADPRRMGYVGRRPGLRDSDAWFTPAKYVEASRTVLGRIDLDPFSDDVANLTVGAKLHYTEADNAFECSWLAGTVWMNPPYAGTLCRRAVEKFVEEYRRGAFQTGIVLVNNATETRFFQLLLSVSRAVCLTSHRIAFENRDGKRISGNTRGQAFFYVARKPHLPLFKRVFSQFGKVLVCK